MKKLKRLILICGAVLIITSGLFSVNAAQQGKWVLTETRIEDNTVDYSKRDNYNSATVSGFSSTNASYSPGSLTIHEQADITDEQFKNTPAYHTQHDYTVSLNWEVPPQEISTENIRDMKLTLSGNIIGLTESPYFINDMYLDYDKDAYFESSGTLTDGINPGNIGVSYANPNVSREVFIDKDGFPGEKGDTLTITVHGGAPLTVEYIYHYENGTATKIAGGSQTIYTDADNGSGETPYSVPQIIVIGLAGMAAALAGASGVAASASGPDSPRDGSGKEKEDHGSTYKMIVYKDFGDKIRYDKPGVSVHARMAEIRSDGKEVPRMDLTEKIQISSGTSCLKVGSSSLSGEYVGALVEAESIIEAENPKEGIISFQFTGEGGIFQNNMKFNLVGDCAVVLLKKQLFVLGTSKRSFELPYELADFTNEPKITVNAIQENPPFELSLGTTREGKNVIIARDCEDSKPFESFFDLFTCEIIAENENEYARSVFDVEMCHEGILPDFLGKPKEIRGYKVSLDSDEMSETLFNVKLGLWNEPDKTLEFILPDKVEISVSDEKNIFQLIGIDILPDENSVLTDAIRYCAKAQKNFPSSSEVKGTMLLSALRGDKTFENDVEILLIPDILQYDADYEKEYQSCKRIIEIYMAPRFRGGKLYELEKARYSLGSEDFKLFRRNCWSVAETSIIQEGQEYLAEAAWYDEAIANAELLVYIGDIAFGLALAPIGGPIAGFLADQVKSSFIEVCTLYIDGSDKSLGELLWDFGVKRFEQSAGAADGLIAVPKATEPGKLALWISLYVLYRIGYHLIFDKDAQNNSIGITESINRGLLDFVGKGAGILLGDYMMTMGKGRWVEKISVADADQKLVDDTVSKVAGAGLNAMDKMARKGDDLVAEVVEVLQTYVEKLKLG